MANDPANPCIGCGPSNPLGLQLAFVWDGKRATAPFTVRPEHVGWPGSCHTGVLYIALVETANWTLYGSLDRAGFPVRTGPLETRRRVPVGETLTLRGRVVDRAEPRVEAEALGVDGEFVARIERTYALLDAAQVAERLGYGEVPAVLEGMFPAGG